MCEAIVEGSGLGGASPARTRVTATKTIKFPHGRQEQKENKPRVAVGHRRPVGSATRFTVKNGPWVVERSYNGPTRLGARAGTGKTVVAVHRTVRLKTLAR